MQVHSAPHLHSSSPDSQDIEAMTKFFLLNQNEVESFPPLLFPWMPFRSPSCTFQQLIPCFLYSLPLLSTFPRMQHANLSKATCLPSIFFLLIFVTCSRCAVPQDPVGLWQEGAAWHLLSPMHEARPAAPAGCVGTLQPYNWLHAWSPLWLIKPFSSTPEEKNK